MNKLYLENIRSRLDIVYDDAETVIEKALTLGYLAKGFEILYPDGAVALTLLTDYDPIPEIIVGHRLVDGDYEKAEFRSTDLKRRDFYIFTEDRSMLDLRDVLYSLKLHRELSPEHDCVECGNPCDCGSESDGDCMTCHECQYGFPEEI